ncbi:ABC transporter substrate-binding protein [Amycolatopsis saalfeldensis]|uniref:Carbohydrate ABC transporter substrate-binding protein, CUT1 family n=1 Tax=Amycolatopsis saalfeldensis TaxID=394193 RepID=A0A1H8WM45_9PSEU|nr:sugar ABC transporter substrate-binding protein [Amycolatopsis saalfeldensis]SEP28750.1 carbohydrate ABC transporter substrate-binding protein, CUT1 family [Amycolatopsis saalfeldensis]
MQQRNRRSFLTLAGMGAVGAVAAACGSDTGRPGDPPPSTAASAGPPPSTSAPKVTLQQWYHAYGEDGVQDAVKNYAASYPNSLVKVQWNPGDYDSKIVTALQNSAVPDVFEAQVKIDWVRQNQVVALDDLIAPVKNDFSPAVLAAQTVEGKVYGIPQAVDTQVLFYRKSLLQAAGVQPPQTVDELIDAAGKLSKDGVKGLFVGNDGGVATLTGPLLWSAGLDYLKNNNREVGFDDPRAATAFGKLHTLNANGSLLLGAPADWSDPGAFIDGLAAMQWTGLWNVPKIRDALDEDFGVLAFPKLDNSGAPSVPVGAYGAMVNAKSAHVNEAKAFVKWLWIDQTNDQLEFATRFGFHLPARQSLVAKAGNLSSGVGADVAKFVQENSHLVGGPVWTQASNTALSDAVAKIAKEGADPVATTKTAVGVAQAELKRLFG